MKILILSQPKCGSTALFYKVKSALPDGAASFFEPKDLGAVIAEVATHQDAVCKYLILPWETALEPRLLELIGAFDRVVVLHRDPRDFMVSCYLYSFYDSITAKSVPGMAQTLRILEQKERDPASIGFIELIRLKNNLERGDYIRPDLSSIPTVRDSLGNRPDFAPHPLAVYNKEIDRVQQVIDHDLRVGGFLSYVLRSGQAMSELKKQLDGTGAAVYWMPYGDLVAKRFDGMERYLGLALATGSRVDQRFARVVRTKGSGDWKNWATPEDLPWMAQYFNAFLQQFGYPADWELPAQPHLSPALGSDYVYGLFAERHERQLRFSRGDLARLADYLWAEPPRAALWLPELTSAMPEDIGDASIRIEDIRFEDSQGQEVNLLVPGSRYFYVYRVSFGRAVAGADFWMQIGYPRGDGILRGSSLLGEGGLSDHRENSSVLVRFPFVCELQNGLYFCNAGVTHKVGEQIEVLRRRVAAIPVLVFGFPSNQHWVVPQVIAD